MLLLLANNNDINSHCIIISFVVLIYSLLCIFCLCVTFTAVPDTCHVLQWWWINCILSRCGGFEHTTVNIYVFEFEACHNNNNYVK